MDLEDKVKDIIGRWGPQLPQTEYHKRIEEEIKHLDVKGLLMLISYALEESNVKFSS